MSSTESLLDLHWPCVLTLFVASVVTLLVYFVQYFSHFSHPGSQTEIKEDSEEAEELLCWTLGLKSWRSEWRRAWLRALNQQSKAEVRLSFSTQINLGITHSLRLSFILVMQKAEYGSSYRIPIGII